MKLWHDGKSSFLGYQFLRCSLFFFFKFFFFIIIILAIPQGTYMGPQFPNQGLNRAPHSGSVESQPLDCKESPEGTLLMLWMLAPPPWHRLCFSLACILFSVEESPSPQWSRITSSVQFISPGKMCLCFSTHHMALYCSLLFTYRHPDSPHPPKKI